jgi:hypothetical protein
MPDKRQRFPSGPSDSGTCSGVEAVAEMAEVTRQATAPPRLPHRALAFLLRATAAAFEAFVAISRRLSAENFLCPSRNFHVYP